MAELFADLVHVQLFHASAGAAYQQLKAMRVFGARAGHIGIERLDAMHQALLDEKFQGAIDGRWPRRGMLGGEPVQQIIGLEAAGRGGDHFQHAPA